MYTFFFNIRFTIMYFLHYFINKKRNCKTINNIFTNIKKIKKTSNEEFYYKRELV